MRARAAPRIYQEEHIVRQTNKKIGLLLALCLGLASAVTLAQSERVNEAIKSRLTPVGSVCMAGDECAGAQTASPAAGDGPRSAEDIYAQSCATCHNAGIAGAPKLGAADDWVDPVAQGMDTLYANAINGIGGMPAMGLCGTCSEEEIRLTVDYMLEESQ